MCLAIALYRRGGAAATSSSCRVSGSAECRRERLPAPSLVVLPRELPRRLDRLGAAGAEEDAVQIPGRERRDLRRQLDRARMGVRPVRVERQLAHLLERRLADLVAERVADVDGEEAGECVDVAPPVRVLEMAAVTAHDDRDVLDAVPAHAGEVHPEVLLGGALQIDRLDGGHRHGSLCSSGAAVLPEDVSEGEGYRDQEDEAGHDVDLGRDGRRARCPIRTRGTSARRPH